MPSGQGGEKEGALHFTALTLFNAPVFRSPMQGRNGCSTMNTGKHALQPTHPEVAMRYTLAVFVMLMMASAAWAEQGFDPKYERDYNIFNPTNQYRPDNPLNPTQKFAPDNPFNPINKFDPNNPVNPLNQYNPNNPFNPVNKYSPENPLNPTNRYNPNSPFKPLNK